MQQAFSGSANQCSQSKRYATGAEFQAAQDLTLVFKSCAALGFALEYDMTHDNESYRTGRSRGTRCFVAASPCPIGWG